MTGPGVAVCHDLGRPRPEIEVREVGPRDGLQSVKSTLSTVQRVSLVRSLVDAGLGRIEVGSFVSPRAVPQMAGTDEVLAALGPSTSTTFETLVLNDRGTDSALAAGSTQLVTVVAASDTFSRRNSGLSTQEATGVAERAMVRAAAAGAGCVADIATAFGCAYEGPVRVGAVVATARALADAGYQEITVADTIGAAAPNDVFALVGALRAELGERVELGLHLHDTRGLGLANVLAGIQAGIRLFDSSIGGIGGCPFSPGATGNICTEDLVHMLQAMGLRTGVELGDLLEVAHRLEGTVGSTLPGRLLRAGPSFAGSPRPPT